MDPRDGNYGDPMTNPHSAGGEAPGFTMPANACDCHMHVFDSSLPFAANAVLTHEAATVEQYRSLQRRLGSTRNVVVQPSSYGTDHRAMLAALAQFGDAARGVAVVTPETPDAELEELAASGVVAARLNLVQRGATDVAMARPLASRLRRLGWHLQVHMKPEDFLNEVDMLLALDIDVVVDHFARVFCDRELAPLMERSVLKLLASGHGWLKLSGAYMAVPSGSHDLGELDNFVAAVKELHTSRLIWGTDWPHATEVEKPNDATLANLLATWFPEATTRQSILTTNPARLYGFRD
ncbi:amidohydrolase [Cupriavidus sp. SW-Y-13]|uniref:amidohydrolase family protein n=1 Tax=Cupriavidus sp. SW-Y-13 TaxID=2653854 RepID=UPI001365A7E9|nr:amidohydrolase family protein [Cupriavidus sp. SW-Y-13]MWL91521.1 amidohydrolase family protein [Cupriavidus sp. SW-Y-13]